MIPWIKKSALFLFLMLVFLHCGGSGPKNKSTVGDVPQDISAAPSVSAPPDANLESLAVNTFLPDTNITVSPLFIEFAPGAQNKKVTATFTLNNGTPDSKKFTVNITGLSGGFRVVEDDASYWAFKNNIAIDGNASKEFKVEFDAADLGVRTAFLDITALEVPGQIRLPVRGTVSGVGNFKIIGSNFKCSSKKAPEIDLLDFKKVSSGSSKPLTIKFCNRGGQDIKIDSASFSPRDIPEDILPPNPLIDFAPSIDETINPLFYSYYNLPATESFTPPAEPQLSSAAPDAVSAFSIREKSTGVSPNGLLIAAGSFAKFEVTFAPNSEMEADPDQPILTPYPANLGFDTTEGGWDIGVKGMSGGKQPQLELSYKTPQMPAPAVIDLDNPSNAIDFGSVEIFRDWTAERPSPVTLIFKNNGNGSEPLKIWFDPLTTGYFTFVRTVPEQTLPFVIPAGGFKTVKLRYSPTPVQISPSADVGQLIIHDNGANGPENRIMLIGKQTAKETDSFQVEMNGSTLGKHSYTTTTPKNLCAVTGSSVDIPLVIHNNSTIPSNLLRTGWSVSATSPVSPRGGTFQTAPGQSSTLHLIFDASNLPEANTIRGALRLTNQFMWQGRPVNVGPYPYEINFKIQLTETGQCGNGGAVDGHVNIVIDRITMNLIGNITEPTRNHPAFKFYLPIELDKAHQTARIATSQNFDTGANVEPTTQIRAYAHQLTSVNSCSPLPTNPYKLEFESGSWDGPSKACAPFDLAATTAGLTGTSMHVDGSAACMENNGAQEMPDPDDHTKMLKVFYHEFAKLDSNGCSPQIYGRIATFNLKQDQSVGDVFHAMEAIGIDKTAAEYQEITKSYGLGSYIHFNEDYQCGSTPHHLGEEITDADQIEECWKQMGGDNNMQRHLGMIEECSYFQFTIAEGTVPTDMSNPDSWEGFGTYKQVDPDNESQWELTLRNVHLEAFVVVDSLNSLFTNAGKLLYSKLNVTLTTRGVGGEGSHWQDLIAVESRDDFIRGDVFKALSEGPTHDYWWGDGINSQWTTGETDDARACFAVSANGRPTAPFITNDSCKGNYQITSDSSHLVHAGEPVDFDHDGRLLLVGLGGFHGKGELAPPFAQETNGKGAPLYFTFHGCLKGGEINPGDNVGCYEEKLDDAIDPSGHRIIDAYQSGGILTAQDVNPPEPDPNADPSTAFRSKALINYKIFDEDRRRLTNYYDRDHHYIFNSTLTDYYGSSQCGFGM